MIWELCYSNIYSFKKLIEKFININNQRINLTKALIYLESESTILNENKPFLKNSIIFIYIFINTIISKFRKVFEKLPEIVQKILGMFYSASEYCREKGGKILPDFMKQYALSIVGGFINIGVNNFSLIKEVIFDLCSKFKLSDFSFKNCINFMKNYASKYKELAKIGFESKFALVSYGI